MKEELVSRGDAAEAATKIYGMLYDAFSQRKVDRKGRLEALTLQDSKRLGKETSKIINAIPARVAVKYEIKVRKEDAEMVAHAMLMAGYMVSINPIDGTIRWEVKA